MAVQAGSAAASPPAAALRRRTHQVGTSTVVAVATRAPGTALREPEAPEVPGSGKNPETSNATNGQNGD
jgi:hypothetical protein